MKLTVTILQTSHTTTHPVGPRPPRTRVTRSKSTHTTALADNVTLADLRKVWEAEQALNSIPGSNLRVHIDITE